MESSSYRLWSRLRAAGYTVEAAYHFDEAVSYRRRFTQQNLPTRAENYRLNVYRSISLQILLSLLVLLFSELAVWAFPLC
jgi:hypothetical protein